MTPPTPLSLRLTHTHTTPCRSPARCTPVVSVPKVVPRHETERSFAVREAGEELRKLLAEVVNCTKIPVCKAALGRKELGFHHVRLKESKATHPPLLHLTERGAPCSPAEQCRHVPHCNPPPPPFFSFSPVRPCPRVPAVPPSP